MPSRISRQQGIQKIDAARIVTQWIPLEDIEDHPDNYNIHPEQQVEQLGQSHEEIGQFRSIVVWARPQGKFIRVTGHGYSAGAKSRGETMLRAEVLPEDTPPATVKAIMLADNLHARHSEMDDTLLRHLLEEQQTLGSNLAALGSDEALLLQLFAADEDETGTSEREEDAADEDDDETLMPLSTGVEASHSLPHLAFGKYRVPLTEEEYASLQFRVEAHLTQTGSYYGFVRSLLHV